jgi:hypothetical protein
VFEVARGRRYRVGENCRFVGALSMKRDTPCCDMPGSDELTRASILLNSAHLLIAALSNASAGGSAVLLS